LTGGRIASGLLLRGRTFQALLSVEVVFGTPEALPVDLDDLVLGDPAQETDERLGAIEGVLAQPGRKERSPDGLLEITRIEGIPQFAVQFAADNLANVRPVTFQ